MNGTEALRIVNAYGSVLQDTSPMGPIRDASLLGQPKQRIKVAILLTLRGTDDSAMRELLREGFAHLAIFQDLSTDQSKALQTWNRFTGRDLKGKTADEIKRVAAEMAAVGDVVTELANSCAVESEKLLGELKAAGF